jgi:hypothetical protein
MEAQSSRAVGKTQKQENLCNQQDLRARMEAQSSRAVGKTQKQQGRQN